MQNPMKSRAMAKLEGSTDTLQAAKALPSKEKQINLGSSEDWAGWASSDGEIERRLPMPDTGRDGEDRCPQATSGGLKLSVSGVLCNLALLHLHEQQHSPSR